MILNPSPEEKDDLKPLAQAEAWTFLQTQLEAVQAKIDKRSAYLEQAYPEGETPPRGQAELMEVYQLEKILIEELMRESQDRLFVDVLRLRKEKAQRRLFEMGTWGRDNPEFRRQRWQAKTEAEALSELQRRWLQWLKA